jgi:DNA repair protein RecO (recombination protein O)
MPLVTTQATILKTYEYSETSKILRLLTRDHGLCSAIAKGARRPKSRFGGLLEPFTDGVATFYAKEGRELHTLSSFELRRERQALGRDLLRYAGAGLLTEIALRFASFNPDSELFEQLRDGLDRLVGEAVDTETAVLEETWKMVVLLGFAPAVERCSACNREPAPDLPAYFHLSGGAVVCAGCQPETKDLNLRPLTSRAWVELVALVGGGGAKLNTARFQRTLVRDFIAHHLADHKPLNSFRFMDEQLG